MFFHQQGLVSPTTNDPILWSRSSQLFRHLQLQNLCISYFFRQSNDSETISEGEDQEQKEQENIHQLNIYFIYCLYILSLRFKLETSLFKFKSPL